MRKRSFAFSRKKKRKEKIFFLWEHAAGNIHFALIAYEQKLRFMIPKQKNIKNPLTKLHKTLHFDIFLQTSMKNIIGDHIDLSQIPLHLRKTFHIDDFLIKKEVQITDNGEELVTIDAQNPHIKIAPFWEDAPGNIQVSDQELQYMIDLE